MADLLREENPIARKEHRCEFCNGKIEKGEKYTHLVYADCGNVSDYKLHDACREALNDYFDEYPYEDYWLVHEVMDFVNEKLKENGIEPAKYVDEAVHQYVEMKKKKEAA